MNAENITSLSQIATPVHTLQLMFDFFRHIRPTPFPTNLRHQTFCLKMEKYIHRFFLL